MNNSTLKRIGKFFIAIFAALIFVQLFYNALINLEQIPNTQKAEAIYTASYEDLWNSIDSYLEEASALIQDGHLSDKDLGLLCERVSLIYLQKGDTVSYYKYLGYALYYLEKTDEGDHTINIYMDLANFHLNNYDFNMAKEMIDKALSIKDFDQIEDLQIKSYAYRMLGILAIMKYEYNDAETYLNISQRILDESSAGTFEEQYRAMNDVWLARVYEETGRLSKCKETLDRWEDSYMFSSTSFESIINRDFVVPYYQAKCYYLCAENIKERNNPEKMDVEAREQAVIDYLHEFMDFCEDNNYEKAELYTILKVQREYPTRNEAIQKEIQYILTQLYTTLFEQQNQTYSNVINNIVYSAKDELENKAMIFHKRMINLTIFSFIAAIIICIGYTFVLLLDNNRYDELTKLLTKKVFVHDLNRLKRSKNNYAIIMMDVDDFKIINDSYGHPEGDIVLWRLGQIISKETTNEIKAYRYGGEEFVIIAEGSASPYANKIAERIRHYMEQQGWEFAPDRIITISAGIAVGCDKDDVVKEADNKLYISKSNGKNQITS